MSEETKSTEAVVNNNEKVAGSTTQSDSASEKSKSPSTEKHDHTSNTRKNSPRRTKSPRQSSIQDAEENTNIEKVIKINRVNKVVKGGKRLAFRAFVISGDQKGNVGIGLGKSKEVPIAIKKAVERSKKRPTGVLIINGTLPHKVVGRFGAAKVVIKPAKPGTGVIAGGAARILLEAAGYRDVVAKSLGSSNPINVARATLNALESCRDLKTEEKNRGKSLPVYF